MSIASVPREPTVADRFRTLDLLDRLFVSAG
jgi:hypothetical protein